MFTCGLSKYSLFPTALALLFYLDLVTLGVTLRKTSLVYSPFQIEIVLMMH